MNCAVMRVVESGEVEGRSNWQLSIEGSESMELEEYIGGNGYVQEENKV